MSRFMFSRAVRQFRVASFTLVAFLACTDSSVVDPRIVPPDDLTAARPTGGPTVKSTNPDSATVDTTLNVRVFGSGYDQGSRAEWAFKGVVSAKIVTNSTVFVSSTELLANITIAPDANIGSHDVIVTTKTGKPGIGTELFAVTIKPTATSLPTFGGATAEALAINDEGTIVGYASQTNASRNVPAVIYPARWVRNAEGRWEVPTRLGAAAGRALALNERGDAVGTRNGSALLWPATGGEITLPDGAVAQGINNAGIIVGGTVWSNRGAARAWVPDPSSPSGWSSRALRPLQGGAFSIGFAINESGVIAGVAVSAAGFEQVVVWLPEGDGWSAPVLLFGTEASTGSSGGYGINAGGDVVGYQSACSGCGFRAYFWPATGGSVNLTALQSGASGSHAHAIADDQRVVGHFNAQTGTNPFLWQPGNTTLADLGAGEAVDINNPTARYGQEAVGFSAGPKGRQATVWRLP